MTQCSFREISIFLKNPPFLYVPPCLSAQVASWGTQFCQAVVSTCPQWRAPVLRECPRPVAGAPWAPGWLTCGSVCRVSACGSARPSWEGPEEGVWLVGQRHRVNLDVPPLALPSGEGCRWVGQKERRTFCFWAQGPLSLRPAAPPSRCEPGMPGEGPGHQLCWAQ